MIVIKFGGHAMSDKNGDFAQTVKSAISMEVTESLEHKLAPAPDWPLPKNTAEATT